MECCIYFNATSPSELAPCLPAIAATSLPGHSQDLVSSQQPTEQHQTLGFHLSPHGSLHPSMLQQRAIWMKLTPSARELIVVSLAFHYHYSLSLWLCQNRWFYGLPTVYTTLFGLIPLSTAKRFIFHISSMFKRLHWVLIHNLLNSVCHNTSQNPTFWQRSRFYVFFFLNVYTYSY